MCTRFSRLAGAILFFCSMVLLSPILRAADFVVVTRDDVLVLTSKIQATQFLTHATFGGTQSEIDQLAIRMRQIGTIAAASEWIDAQMELPASFHNPLEISMLATDFQFGSLYTGSTPIAGTPDSTNAISRVRYRQHAWWHSAITGPDQLRQRTAWALAQILSVGEDSLWFSEEELDAALTGGQLTPIRSLFQGLTNYYDILVANAFGRYKEILGKVTYHANMGDWLGYRGNRRAQNGIAPDEAYALELMRRFSIGSDELNDDGSPRTNAQGVVPTYNADDIREYAEVFTGLGYGYGTYAPSNTALNPYSPYTGAVASNSNLSVKYQVPMRMAPAQHDRSTKTLLNGLVLTNVNGSDVTHTENSANTEINAALDGLIAHSSCPPFIVNRLIQRLVKSNPSRAYMSRCVNVFKDNGQGVRGDLKAVVKAILLDPEAWQPIRVQYQRLPVGGSFVVTTMGTEDSRLQEPVLNYTRFTRFFKATSQYQKATAGVYPTTIPFPAENVVSTEFRLNSLDSTFDQSPYRQPSPIGFYNADFQPAGEAMTYVPSPRLQTARLFAPEFQIVTALTSNPTGNFFRTISFGSKTENNLIYSTNAPLFSTQFTNTAGVTNIATESTRTVVTYNMSVERAMLIDQPAGEPNGSPIRINRLLEHLDMYLCGGTLNDGDKGILRNAITDEVVLAGGVGDISTNEATNIARGAILSILSSPSFLVTE